MAAVADNAGSVRPSLPQYLQQLHEESVYVLLVHVDLHDLLKPRFGHDAIALCSCRVRARTQALGRRPGTPPVRQDSRAG